MTVVSGTIPNFINGVSQQPYALRLASQGAEQINGYSTIAEGLVKRPPTNHVARLTDPVTAGTFLHTIVRDAAERYFVVIGNGSLRVFGIDGSAKTVNFPDGTAYLSGLDFAAVSVADYTIIVNKSVVAAMAAEVAPPPSQGGLIYVRQGNYSTSYSVIINGGPITYTTSDDDPATIRTGAIASHLAGQIAAFPAYYAGVIGSTIQVTRYDGADFTLSAADDVGDASLIAVKGTLQQFTDLPAKAPDGCSVEITGTPTNAFDNFYVRFNATADFSGVWKEVAKPGRQVALNKATMPFLLVREADGTFTFKAADWGKCAAGNELTVPAPSFIGQTISDVFFTHNRLGIISGEQVVFSRSADLFNFWKQTATALLDTDPIDLSANHTKVSTLRHAISFNEELLLFSDAAQFVLSAPDVLTPKTAAINLSTEFVASSRVRPVGSGSFLYFAAARGTATSIQEYYVDGNNRSKEATDITAHVPHYIPPGCFKLAVSGPNKLLIGLVEGTPNKVFAYQSYTVGQEKQQSAWHRWEFPQGDSVLEASFIDDSLYLLIQRTTGLFLERIDLDIGIKSGELPYAVLLDRRVSEGAVSFTYDATSKSSTVTLPYSTSSPLQLVVVQSTDPAMPAGYRPKLTVVSGNQVRVKGNLTGKAFRVGVQYAFRYDFSTFITRKPASGGGLVADTSGRLQILRLTVNYADTGYFRVEVTPSRRDTYTYPFTGRVIGSAKAPIGQAGVETGSFRVPVMAQNVNVTISIINDSHIPCRFLTADWEGQRVSRSRPIS